LFDAGVDAVVLGTEEHLRTAAALGALERGVHVYLPKPFAYTAADAARLRDGARRSAATLFPGLPHRWHAHFRRAAELMTPDHLGRPLLARSAVVHHLSAGPWKSDPAMAAGPEFEMGFYAVDGLLMVMGATPRRVTAQATNQLHPRIDGFDFATLQVGFDSGTIGTADLYCGLEYPYRGHELQATGEHGGVWLGRGAGGQTELRVYGAEGERDEPVPAMGREAELSRWLEVCRRGDRETAGDLFESGCRTLGVLLAFKEAWRRREAVEVVTP
jgi:predicted dehydrogenase